MTNPQQQFCLCGKYYDLEPYFYQNCKSYWL